MKNSKRYIAAAAAAAIMLCFAGCGSVDKEKTSDSTKETFAVASSAASADIKTADGETSDSVEGGAELVLPTDSETDPGTPADPGVTEVGSPDDTAAGGNIADHVFKTVNGDYTYEGLSYDGLANTSNGKAYCLVPNDAAAGTAYYQVYYSADGGKTWTDGGTYSENTGNNYHYALSDGRIILFNANGPASINVPNVFALSLSDSGSVTSQKIDGFFDITLDDGTQLSSISGLSFYVTYNGGYNFTFSFTDEYGNMVYNDVVELDPTTLKIS